MFNTFSRWRRRTHPASPCHPPSATRLSVSYVDDPDHRVRVIRAAGHLTAESTGELLRSWEHLTAPRIIHLDAGALDIDIGAMRRLETAFDHLERQRIDVRVVGIDPTHPALLH